MKITIKKNIRKFKKGDTFEFDFSNRDDIMIVAANASGKSTLLNIIRAYRDDSKSAGRGVSRSLNYYDISLEFGGAADIDAPEFGKMYHFSSEFDDPMSMKNSADASAFIINGGFALQSKSEGERTYFAFSKFLGENFGANLEGLGSGDAVKLIALDEPDRGFDLRKQAGFRRVIGNLCRLGKGKVKVLWVSHNALPVLMEDEVFDICARGMASSREWLRKETALDITYSVPEEKHARVKKVEKKAE